MFNPFSKTKKITEKLYEQNLELAVKNKTLSLLEELYQTSVLALTPEQMARKITETIRKDLNLELAGVLIFKKEADTLEPLAFAQSDRLTKTLNMTGFLFEKTTLQNVSQRELLKKVVVNQKDTVTSNIAEFWKEFIEDNIGALNTDSHIKTVLLYPLITDKEVLGMLVLGLNRQYDTLNTFEKASIRSFINVISLLLDKAYLYKNLQDSYEVTKKAYAIEKQAKEELEKLDKIKNQFLAQTQHDLRTPLGIIRDYCDLLYDGAFGKQTKKALDIIKRIQAVAENKIKDVNNFLDTTQFQLGKKVVSLKPGIELNAILDEIIKDFAFQIESKGIALTLRKPEKVFIVEADREKLKAALFNIIDNSIKYTPKGSVSVTVDASLQNAKPIVSIVVKDTGIGIPKEKLATLFDTAFERGEQAQKTFATGRGIGMYLSSQIIKAHNGKVWVESEGEGKGSTFHVELPVQ